ncbi:MAG: hypothetical protein C7B45_01445 [Sulfobacillus acidophilus]|uniref:Uroporphyrinogen decarboxylase (URO-D) domain-containing protein n=1 Tax=Sulfobacillus acidophilus TaxID=53633 RepID=A0A2T2WP15_9FIRM|nr:MAG: hypothetical protein C7B45_01445 [Sulfobacillus acidophilus]
MPKTAVGLWAYPWDLQELGAAAVLRQLQEWRISELAVATVYHSGQILSLMGPDPRWIMQPSGPLVDFSDPFGMPVPLLADLRVRLSDAGIILRGWTVLGHDKHGWDPTINVFGQAMVHAACPVANQPRATTLIGRLSDSGYFDVLDLEALDFMSAIHGAHHEIIGPPMTPLIELLFSLCFCQACSRTFGSKLDWDALTYDVRTSLREVVQHECIDIQPLSQLTTFLQEHPLIQHLLDERSLWLNRYLRALSAASAIPLTPMISSYRGQQALSWMAGWVPDASWSSDIIALGYGSPETVWSDLNELLLKGLAPEQIICGQTLVAQATPTLAVAKSRVEQAFAAGIRRFCFYNWGLLNQPRREWLNTLSALIWTMG